MLSWIIRTLIIIVIIFFLLGPFLSFYLLNYGFLQLFVGIRRLAVSSGFAPLSSRIPAFIQSFPQKKAEEVGNVSNPGR